MSPRRWDAVIFVALTFVTASVAAQTPTAPSPAPAMAEMGSSLGPLPGMPSDSTYGADLPSGVLVGRGIRRVPSSISRPVGLGRSATQSIERLPTTRRYASRASRFTGLAIPIAEEDVGPVNGLTLDQAIEIFRRENLLLRSRYLEIPQASADLLSAGLRANPFVYVDGQLLPYGQFNPTTNPGGPAQYDINVTLPVDWNLKRRARMAVAQRAKNVVEAVYQNTVRVQMGELYNAYVDVLAGRETARLARTAQTNMQQALAMVKAQPETAASAVDIDQMELQFDSTELGLLDAEATLRTSKRRLAALLNLPSQGAERIELQGTIRDKAPPPPPLTELVQLAISARPDLAAFHLGTERARSDVDLARKNRFSDVYLLYQPYTYQNNQPFNAPSSRSWALGATVAVPLWDRNQGVIRKAQTNLDQTRIETQAQERLAIADVEDAYTEYVLTRSAVERMEQHLLPHAQQALKDNLQLYLDGKAPFISYLGAQRDYAEMVRQFRDMLVRHRRSMLDLNTAVGQRVLP